MKQDWLSWYPLQYKLLWGRWSAGSAFKLAIHKEKCRKCQSHTRFVLRIFAYLSCYLMTWNPAKLDFFKAVEKGCHWISSQGCRPRGVPGAPWDPQILADQLTLSQPGGRLCPPNNTGFSDLPTALHRQLLATNWAPEIDLRTGSWLTCDFFRQITITK